MNKVSYVGLNVPKNTISVAGAGEGRSGEIWFFGTIAHTADSVLRLTKQLAAPGNTPSFCYEADPCGYGLHRHLTKFGLECAVIAPAMIPRKAGDRLKTDHRAAEMLHGCGVQAS